MTSEDYKFEMYNVCQNVVEKVIGSLKDLFLDEGVDEAVLDNLKDLWESKILASKAFSKPGENMDKPPLITSLPLNPSIPVQIVLPTTTNDGNPIKVSVIVPVSIINSNLLSKILTGQVIKSILNLPVNTAAVILQQHINNYVDASLKGELPSCSGRNELIVRSVQQPDGPKDEGETSGIKSTNHQIHQVDGFNSSSSSSDDDDDEENEDESSMGDIDELGDEVLLEGEEVLNSEDDITEESDLDDTENLIVCQYEKVVKCRNQWKFFFKDGIMNLAGKEYVFKKATGEGKW